MELATTACCGHYILQGFGSDRSYDFEPPKKDKLIEDIERFVTQALDYNAAIVSATTVSSYQSLAEKCLEECGFDKVLDSAPRPDQEEDDEEENPITFWIKAIGE